MFVTFGACIWFKLRNKHLPFLTLPGAEPRGRIQPVPVQGDAVVLAAANAEPVAAGGGKVKGGVGKRGLPALAALRHGPEPLLGQEIYG